MERSIFVLWRAQGLSARAANILCALSCKSIDDVLRLGPKTVYAESAIGMKTFNEIARLTGWPLKSAKKPRSWSAANVASPAMPNWPLLSCTA
jgi:hypothetical protein